MLARWPIRNKLWLGLGLLALIVSALSWSGLHGIYAYRGLVKSLGRRSVELPLASELAQHVSDWRVSLRGASPLLDFRLEGPAAPPYDVRLLREDFRLHQAAVHKALQDYRLHLEQTDVAKAPFNDNRAQWQTLRALEQAFQRVSQTDVADDWLLDRFQRQAVDQALGDMQVLAGKLPRALHESIHQFSTEARLRYRTLIFVSAAVSVSALVLTALFVHLSYAWVFRPLGILIRGSRRIASGQFDHVIPLDANDEMAELASALNDMTARFRAIRDDLDRQVQERTKQVVRSEQLASVGFLAAGVAHEINNPLASIALCAESLESRLASSLADNDDQAGIIRSYLQMIQDEAFRCKEITAKLLDFSRLGDMQRQPAELRDLVQGVIDMVRHLGGYQHKEIVFLPGPPVVALVNAAEIKQVVLNLLTNALDSLDPGGRVQIALADRDHAAELDFLDNGCGMTHEVLEHLFEPFFTRRRGGQGTGLGLSISYRIIVDHGGQIEASSTGPNQGSRFLVRLPLARTQPLHKELSYRYQAA